MVIVPGNSACRLGHCGAFAIGCVCCIRATRCSVCATPPLPRWEAARRQKRRNSRNDFPAQPVQVRIFQIAFRSDVGMENRLRRTDQRGLGNPGVYRTRIDASVWEHLRHPKRRDPSCQSDGAVLHEGSDANLRRRPDDRQEHGRGAQELSLRKWSCGVRTRCSASMGDTYLPNERHCNCS